MSSQNRTTVRLPLRHRLTRGAFAALDQVAPPVAAIVGSRLWFRVTPTTPAQRRHARQPEGGEAFEITADGLTVRGRVYGDDPHAPTAYLVHGWAGHWQQLGAMVGPLREAGYRVVGHDAPSHGDSPAGHHGPGASSVMELARARALVVERHGEPALTVAHSLGAMAVLWAARHHDTRLGPLVTVAAATEVEELLVAFRQMTGLGRRSGQRLLRRIEGSIGFPVATFHGPTLASEVLADGDAVPLLAIHDRSDADSPARVSERLVDAWPGARLVLTDGLGHRRILWAPEVVAQVSEIAAQQLSPERRR